MLIVSFCIYLPLSYVAVVLEEVVGLLLMSCHDIINGSTYRYKDKWQKELNLRLYPLIHIINCLTFI